MRGWRGRGGEWRKKGGKRARWGRGGGQVTLWGGGSLQDDVQVLPSDEEVKAMFKQSREARTAVFATLGQALCYHRDEGSELPARMR